MTGRLCSLALLLAAGVAFPQDNPPAEPAYRLDVDRVTLEKRAGKQVLTLRATTDLPARTFLDVTLTALVPAYDEGRKAIVAAAVGNPVVRKVRVEPAGRGKGEFSATQPFPREGEIRVDVSFNPELLFEEDRAAAKKAMGERFGRLRWEKTVLLGTPSSRLGGMSSRFGADLAWVSEAEKLVRKLGQVSKGNNGDAITNVCADLNETLAKIEKAEADSPFPAALGHLRRVLGRVAAWGAYRVALTARAAAGGGQDDAAADGGDAGKRETNGENDLSTYREDALLGSLARVRELAVREYAMAGAAELVRVQAEVSSAIRDDWPDERVRTLLRLAAEGARGAVRRHHDSGLSKLGDPYGALFGGEKGAKDLLDVTLARLDQAVGLLSAAAPGPAAAGTLSENLTQDAKALGALIDAWRRLER